jgi:hypothetical protein
MRKPKSMPKHDIGVGDVCGRVGCDPGREAHRGLAAGLRHVSSCRMDLRVVVWSNVTGVLTEIFLRDETYTS